MRLALTMVDMTIQAQQIILAAMAAEAVLATGAPAATVEAEVMEDNGPLSASQHGGDTSTRRDFGFKSPEAHSQDLDDGKLLRRLVTLRNRPLPPAA